MTFIRIIPKNNGFIECYKTTAGKWFFIGFVDSKGFYYENKASEILKHFKI